MGQLDEAIRAHLELKRKHGASEEELQLKEQEALGPVRRDPPPLAAEPEEEPGELVSDPAALGGPDEPELYEDEPIYDEPLEDAPPETFHEPLDPLVDPGFEAATDAGEGEPGLLEDTPPRGFPAVEAEPPDEGEDVLEETPDFLQETPEHDRLWFEQKPPRDFDFDE